jgi:hypothetical protein
VAAGATNAIDAADGAGATNAIDAAGGGGGPAARVALTARPVDGGLVEISAFALAARELYGADVVVWIDPARLVVEAGEGLRSLGAPLAADSAWTDTGGGMVAELRVAEGGVVRFAASRIAPAPALSGDVPLFTIRARPVADGAARNVASFGYILQSLDGAWSVVSAMLVDRGAGVIDARIAGEDDSRNDVR